MDRSASLSRPTEAAIRLNPSLSALIAAAAFARGDTPVKVVLQEAVLLAERYGSARSARFVNGVLDAYARKLGRL